MKKGYHSLAVSSHLTQKEPVRVQRGLRKKLVLVGRLRRAAKAKNWGGELQERGP